MLELSCFMEQLLLDRRRQGPTEPHSESAVITSDGQLQGGLQHDLLLLGKAELCLS